MSSKKKATSAELTGGAGFSFEDLVVAYYLAALLLEERAVGQSGLVTSVAVQQKQIHPMDDVVAEFDDHGVRRSLALQVKRQITISAAPSNNDFREVMADAVKTRLSAGFQVGADAYGFAAEYVAIRAFRDFNRLIDLAKSDPTGENFARTCEEDGAASNTQRELRDALLPLTDTTSASEEADFYRHFVALHLDGLSEGGFLRTEVVNRLQGLVESNEGGQDLLLFDRLCRIAREGAASSRKWTRPTLLAQLRSALRLKIAPNYRSDIERLEEFSAAGLADVSEEIDNFRVERPALVREINDQLGRYRLVNLSGLPGCGKSGMLKRVASVAASSGPILFLKAELLEGKSWVSFSESLGLKHSIVKLLAELGSVGTPILFVDGIDRVTPEQKGIIRDIVRAVETHEELTDWKVLASSRDQGLEVFRTWFPQSFSRDTGIGDVQVGSFSEEESEALAKEKPSLRPLLFGSESVREIARRPFFAAVLANFPDADTTPQTEVDLISAWWERAGHNAPQQSVPQRQRSLIDLAEKGVRNLGKNISARTLKAATIDQVAALLADRIVRPIDGGAAYSFTHDIFFEWAFYRLLIELGDGWPKGLIEAGEPPLLGRVVGLLAQNALREPEKWSAGFGSLENQQIRSQWQREWLTAPPFTPAFSESHQEFQALLERDEYALLEKLLVWFQAEHTMPSPIVVAGAAIEIEEVDLASMADMLSWPSDFQGWSRFLDWLVPLAPRLPPRLFPHILEVFSVWQNVFTEIRNQQSESIIEVCTNWLIDLEQVQYRQEFSTDYGPWEELGREARKTLSTSLRMAIMRSARSYPDPAIALFDRAVANKHMRRKAYSDLMGFTPTMADVSPNSVVVVAKAELMEELPQERLEREEREYRERIEHLRRVRETPNKHPTKKQKLTLQPVFPPSRRDRYGFDDLGIDRHHHYYYPPSALHEPFGSLFAKKPEAALTLVRDLSNHATRGWRETQLLNPEQLGTPIPVVVEFPWGRQEFWGDWRVYNWFNTFAPQPLECALLALRYWAFKQIENGQPADEIIRSVVEGNECYAALGLALLLALETYRVSETVLPIASCQRLWEHDMARVVQEPMRGIDLFGLGQLSRLAGSKAKAKDFLDSRQSRTRDIRGLAMRFALSPDEGLRERFKTALANFPNDLPYEIEEHRNNPAATAAMTEHAVGWAGLGDINNYRQHATETDEVAISYEPPNLPTPEQQARLKETTATLQEYGVIAWAMGSLNANTLEGGISLKDAIAFARARDNGALMAARDESGAHSAQTSVSAVAAVAIRFGDGAGKDYDWAWNVMSRVAVMAEPQDAFGGAIIPWHPARHLIAALVHDRRSAAPRADSVRRLLELTRHPNDGVAELAFVGLFLDADEHVRWVSAQLAMDMCLLHRFKLNDDGQRDHSTDQNARSQSLAKAIEHLEWTEEESLTAVPPAWVKTPGRQHSGRSDEEAEWDEPDPVFNARFASKLFGLFPIESWSQSSVYKPMLEDLLKQLVTWTADRLMPPWREKKGHRSDSRGAELIEWNATLGDMLARAAPFFEGDFVRGKFLGPFLTDDEKGLGVLASFADMTVVRHVFDARTIPSNTLDLLKDCVERVIRDKAFTAGYRAGEVHGYDLPKLISALLFVNIEEAKGARRFINGDWSEVGIVIPVVTPLISAVGWSPYVMSKFLTLCERAGKTYPLSDFAYQANASLALVENARGGWAGTIMPARIAATVQRLADANFPLKDDQAQALLKVLDALIDLGDRRSAALEQTEAFKGVQGAPFSSSKGGAS